MAREKILEPTNGQMYLAPSMGLEQFRQQIDELKSFIEENLKQDVDYGVIPGTPKPTLFKPGAEKLLRWHGLVVDSTVLPSSRLDIEGGVIDVDMEGRVRSVKLDQVLGTVHANCNSEEFRYWSSRHPEEAFGDRGRSRRPQRLGDQKNTILKMCDKRLWVAAALLYTLASEIFTQDVEDSAEASAQTQPRSQQAQASPAAQCPKCHTGILRERTRRDGSGTFWGCSRYPECKYTQNEPPAQAPHSDAGERGSGTPAEESKSAESEQSEEEMARDKKLLINQVKKVAEELELDGKQVGRYARELFGEVRPLAQLTNLQLDRLLAKLREIHSTEATPVESDTEDAAA